MRGFKIIAIIFVLCAFSFSCRTTKEAGHRYIKISNLSNEGVKCQMLAWDKITEADTLYDCRLVTKYSIPTDSFVLIECHIRISDWEYELDLLAYLQFIYMNKERFDYYYNSVENESRCDSVRKNVPIIQRYRLKLEDLQKLDWIVPFPPTEAMKGMDIYPPYVE